MGQCEAKGIDLCVTSAPVHAGATDPFERSASAIDPFAKGATVVYDQEDEAYKAAMVKQFTPIAYSPHHSCDQQQTSEAASPPSLFQIQQMVSQHEAFRSDEQARRELAFAQQHQELMAGDCTKLAETTQDRVCVRQATPEEPHSKVGKLFSYLQSPAIDASTEKVVPVGQLSRGEGNCALRQAWAGRASGAGLAANTDLAVGDVVSIFDDRAQGVVRFVGRTDFSTGHYLGIELDDPIGENNGSVDGIEYFRCEPNYGIFVKPNTVVLVEESPDAIAGWIVGGKGLRCPSTDF